MSLRHFAFRNQRSPDGYFDGFGFYCEAMREAELIYLARKIIIAGMLFFASSLWEPRDAAAITPAGRLQETWEQIVVILKSARFDSKAEIDAFRIKVMRVVSPRFDFAEMAKLCLGSHWESRTRDEREEFVTLFAATLAKSYVGGMRSYENSTILYTREFNDATSAEVDTRIVNNGAKDLLVNYKLHFSDADWKVYDVVIDDISLVDNYRSQFNRVIARSSYAELVRILKEKQQG